MPNCQCLLMISFFFCTDFYYNVSQIINLMWYNLLSMVHNPEFWSPLSERELNPKVWDKKYIFYLTTSLIQIQSCIFTFQYIFSIFYRNKRVHYLGALTVMCIWKNSKSCGSLWIVQLLIKLGTNSGLNFHQVSM